MDVHDVARTDQARVVEIPRLEEERIERSEVPCAARTRITACHVRLQAESGTPGQAFHRIALRRGQRPRENIPPPERSALKDRLDVLVEACAAPEDADAEGLPRLRTFARGVPRVVVSESQVVEIRAERGPRRERRRRSVDAPEELAVGLVVELRLPFAGRLRNEGV